MSAAPNFPPMPAGRIQPVLIAQQGTFAHDCAYFEKLVKHALKFEVPSTEIVDFSTQKSFDEFKARVDLNDKNVIVLDIPTHDVDTIQQAIMFQIILVSKSLTVIHLGSDQDVVAKRWSLFAKQKFRVFPIDLVEADKALSKEAIAVLTERTTMPSKRPFSFSWKWSVIAIAALAVGVLAARYFFPGRLKLL